MHGVTNDSSVPMRFSWGLVIMQLSTCQVHERTSSQIGEHITVLTSVCLKNMQRGDTAGVVCIWAFTAFDPSTCCLVTKRPSCLLDGPDKKDHLVRAILSCDLQAAGVLRKGGPEGTGGF